MHCDEADSASPRVKAGRGRMRRMRPSRKAVVSGRGRGGAEAGPTGRQDLSHPPPLFRWAGPSGPERFLLQTTRQGDPPRLAPPSPGARDRAFHKYPSGLRDRALDASWRSPTAPPTQAHAAVRAFGVLHWCARRQQSAPLHRLHHASGDNRRNMRA